MTLCLLRGEELRREAQFLNIYGRSTVSADRLRALVGDTWRRCEAQQHSFYVSRNHALSAVREEPGNGLAAYAAEWFLANPNRMFRSYSEWRNDSEYQEVCRRHFATDVQERSGAEQPAAQDSSNDDDAPVGTRWTERPIVPPPDGLVPLPDRIDVSQIPPVGAEWERRAVTRIPVAPVPFRADYSARLGRYLGRRGWCGGFWRAHPRYSVYYTDSENRYRIMLAPGTEGVTIEYVPVGEDGYNATFDDRDRGSCRYTWVQYAQPAGPALRSCSRPPSRGGPCLGTLGCEYCQPDLYETCRDGCRGSARYRRPIGTIECVCWRACSRCEQLRPGRELMSGTCDNEPFTNWCSTCMQPMSPCDACDLFFLETEHNCPRYHSCSVCDSGSQSGRIHNYSYKPDPIFFGEGPLYFGLEVEVDTGSCLLPPDTVSRHANNVLDGIAYLKHDGSVNGFEVVTHPMSFDFAMGEFPHNVWTELRDMRARAEESCGIHIHVSRAGFSDPVHTYRWLKMFHRNRRRLQALARRNDEHWCAFTADQRAWAIHAAKAGAQAAMFDSYADLASWDYSSYRSPERKYTRWYVNPEKVRLNGEPAEAISRRYSAVNLLNEHTMEVRIFRSSLDPKEVKAAIQLVHATVEYTRQLTVPAIRSGGWGWPAFVEWFSKNPAYTELIAENALRNIGH